MTEKRAKYELGNKVERMHPARPIGVVVKVSLLPEEADLISKSAETMGMRIAQFVKKAALYVVKYEPQFFRSLPEIEGKRQAKGELCLDLT